jgi:hypothetical protein
LIRDFEEFGYLPKPQEEWQAKLRAVLEEAGVEFVDRNPVPGVRLRKPQP